MREYRSGQSGHQKSQEDDITRINSKETTTLHEMLDLPVDATAAEFKHAYRKIALLIHPDKNKSPEAEQAFVKLDGLYKLYLKEVQKGKSYKSFLSSQESPSDDKSGYYSSYDTSSHEEKFRAEYHARHHAPMVPALGTIISYIEMYASNDRKEGGEFRFGGLMSFHKIKMKDGKEAPVSATCKEIHKIATEAISENRDIKDTLLNILDILEKSKQKKQGLFGRRSSDTQAIHDYIENQVRRMLASYPKEEPRHRRT